MLAEGKHLQAYRFEGYWKDVGTISSLWEANMDVLDCPEDLDLMDASWRIYGRNPVKPAHYVGKNGKVIDSCLTDGCIIHGTASHSVLSHSVEIEEGAIVKDCVLMPGVKVKKNSILTKCIVGMGVVIEENCQIGNHVLDEDKKSHYYNKKLCKDGITVIKHNMIIKANSTIPGNCMVSDMVEEI